MPGWRMNHCGRIGEGKGGKEEGREWRGREMGRDGGWEGVGRGGEGIEVSEQPKSLNSLPILILPSKSHASL